MCLAATGAQGNLLATKVTPAYDWGGNRLTETPFQSKRLASKELTDRILAAVKAKGYKPRSMSDLAQALDVPAESFEQFVETCTALLTKGRIAMGAREHIVPAPPKGQIIGTYRANPRGFGFVVPAGGLEHADLYVPAGHQGGAISGDTVMARVLKRGKRGPDMRYEGRIVEILERGQSRFVGELREVRGRWFVVPDGNRLSAPIVIRDASAKGAAPGDQVVVEIMRYPSEEREAEGVISKVLGARGEPDVSTQSIIEQYELPGPFPDDVLAEAREVTDAYDPTVEASAREDLRKETIITIDPADARDFDDAISLDRTRDGQFVLGVHIADVAHFVREGGALDTEARDRANSIYLPRTVIPMLPELLSNGVCSLQEREPRLTKSAFITYDERGEVKNARVANTIIESTKRLTYEQASQALAGEPGRLSAKVRALLTDMDALARIIRKRRLREGMLELDLPDAELVFDKEGRVIDVVPEDTSFSHKIIEMFMVEANEAVARWLTSLNVPFLRRIHEEPEELTDGTLQRYLRVLGHALPDGGDRFDLQRLLDEVRGKDEQFPLHLAVLRSMNRAEYSPKTIGHYALASDNYCHFTSPIRRYPDLTVHRLLDAAQRGALDTSAKVRAAVNEFDTIELGHHCSEYERRAESAERELRSVFILQLLEDKIGETFDGIVTGFVSSGAFVQIERYLTDGFIPFDQWPNEWWSVDPSQAAAVSERTGQSLKVGDRIKVTINTVNVTARRLDLIPAEPLSGARRNKHVSTRPAKGKNERNKDRRDPRKRPVRGRGARGRKRK